MISNNDFGAFLKLDLDPIKVKLVHQSGEGWGIQRTEAVEMEYRRFLYLMKTYPEEHTAPLEDVDTFWHYHILDTIKYAADCNMLFGYFLHHFPYVGMRGEADEAALQKMGARMAELYESAFGESYIRASNFEPRAYINSGKPAFCSSEAKPAFCSSETKPAFCSSEAKPAFCSSEAKPAFCSAEAKPAFCSAEAKPAFCSAEAKPAFCSAGAKPAFCSAEAKPAFCSIQTKPAICSISTSTANGRLLVGSDFYTVRPTLGN
jgi:hypothetical protein